jgi:hypothetical protein
MKGKWVAIALGSVIGVSETESAGMEIMRRACARKRFHHGIIVQVGSRREEGEWFGGMMRSFEQA